MLLAKNNFLKLHIPYFLTFNKNKDFNFNAIFLAGISKFANFLKSMCIKQMIFVCSDKKNVTMNNSVRISKTKNFMLLQNFYPVFFIL